MIFKIKQSVPLLSLIFLGIFIIGSLIATNNLSAAKTSSNNETMNRIVTQSNSSFIKKWGSSCLLNVTYGCTDPDGPSGPLSLGDGQFSSIWGVAANLGDVYVTDVSNNRIQVFSDNGTFIRAWGSYCDLNTGKKCTDPDGPSGPLSLGDGQFNYPQGIAIDSKGNVYVADSGNNRIQVFSDNGTFIRAWGSTGAGHGEFRHPEGIGIDTIADINGNNIIYVADSGNNRIQVFSDNGTFIRAWGSYCQMNSDHALISRTCSDLDGNLGKLKLGDGQFSHPTSIATDSGYVFVADNLNDRIQVFYSALVSPLQLPPSKTSPPVNNSSPVAIDQNITTNINTPKTIILSASDANSDNLRASVTRLPTSGTLSPIDQETGKITYTPNNDYNGTDSFQFKVTDDEGAVSNVATVDIHVIQVTPQTGIIHTHITTQSEQAKDKLSSPPPENNSSPNGNENLQSLPFNNKTKSIEPSAND
ncbi:MAG TPA: Ig-like domain-containing protein [Nitrososphaeraceae archaeon]|nr:Ig-like domain-containing protein [Nitrososphaeraceae archaeon]